MSLFGLNLLLTARNRRIVYIGERPLTADTRVREAINVRPEIQQKLRDVGVTMLDEAGFVAPSLTFGAMALAWGKSPGTLLAELGEMATTESDHPAKVCSTATSAAAPGA